MLRLPGDELPRLLSLNSYHYRRGGADVVYLDHDAMFRDAGWQTAVLSMHHPRNEPSPWSRFFVDEIEMGRSYPLHRKVGMAGKVVYSLEARRKLTRLLAEFPADVAHAHGIYHHISPSVLGLLRGRGIPTVLTAHDFKLACPAYKMLNRHGICERCRGGNLLHLVRNRCIHGSLALSSVIFVESTAHRMFGLYRRNLDRIVVPSRFHRTKLIEWGWTADRIVHIPNHVHAEAFEPRYVPGDYLLYHGRLTPEKGVATLIAAARTAGVKLCIAGRGPAEESLRRQADGAARIEFVGFVEGPALSALIRESRAVVLPSEIYENAPISLLEGMASGKPAIGARIGGIPELVDEGRTGFLFESGNVEELANLLRGVATATDERLAEMGRAARVDVVERFGPQRYFQAMLDLYRALGVRA